MRVLQCEHADCNSVIGKPDLSWGPGLGPEPYLSNKSFQESEMVEDSVIMSSNIYVHKSASKHCSH
jgi:hypothetical protein